MSDDGWTDIESDPGVFTEMISNFGVKGVQVEELYSMDIDTFRELEPIYGFVFLFKWDASVPESRAYENPEDSDVLFFQQVVNNACATQAILSILLNRGDIDIGPHLEEFKNVAIPASPEVRGNLIRDSEIIRTAHNSFARPEPFVMEKRKATKDDDIYHFISYLPINGCLYELDGLKRGPVNHGPCTDETWLEVVQPVIAERIAKYEGKEIRFNLLALVKNRRELFEDELSEKLVTKARLVAKLRELGVDVPDDGDVTEGESGMAVDAGEGLEPIPDDADLCGAMLVGVNDDVDSLKRKIQREEEKFEAWRIENIRRKHNYIPFLMNMLKLLAKKNELLPLVEKAKAANDD